MKRSRPQREPTIPLVERFAIIPSPFSVLTWILLGLLFFTVWLLVHVPLRLVCRQKGCIGPNSYSPEDYPFSGPPECRRCGKVIDYAD